MVIVVDGRPVSLPFDLAAVENLAPALTDLSVVIVGGVLARSLSHEIMALLSFVVGMIIETASFNLNSIAWAASDDVDWMFASGALSDSC